MTVLLEELWADLFATAECVDEVILKMEGLSARVSGGGGSACVLGLLITAGSYFYAY